MRKVIFLDRDGTINIEKDYLHKIEDFEFENGSIEAIKILNRLGYDIIIVTNQSGIARGYYAEEDLKKLNEFMVQTVEQKGGKILACYYCPHHPEKGVGQYKMLCNCRKPEPGMLLNAKKEYDVDFEKSYIVGDKISDIVAGRKVGVKPILVKTGYGIKTLQKENIDFEVYENLLDFAKKLENSNKSNIL